MTRDAMRVDEARARLASLAAEVVGNDADLAAGWRAYRRFAAEPVWCAEDTLYVQVGPHPKTDATYMVRLGRRFEVNDDEKYYLHTEGVLLAFDMRAHDADALPRLSRANGVPRQWDTFLAGVERDPVFVAALERRPWHCAVESWTTARGASA